MSEWIDCYDSDEGTIVLKPHNKETKKRQLCINGITVSEKHRRIREKAVCSEPSGGRMYKYVRGSGSSLPSEIKEYADLAIRSYNETLPIGYGVVDIVRATKFLCDGFYFRITFTAKLPDQDDADALTFRARVTYGITRTKINSIRVVTAPATSPTIDAPAI